MLFLCVASATISRSVLKEIIVNPSNQTLEDVQIALRQTLQTLSTEATGGGDVIIHLLPGIHRVPQGGLQLTIHDSPSTYGLHDTRVLWKGAGPNASIISGGKTIAGWKVVRQQIDNFSLGKGGHCAADHGSSKPCCGQKSDPGTSVAPQYQCPADHPYCTGYVFDSHWGHCIDTPPAPTPPPTPPPVPVLLSAPIPAGADGFYTRQLYVGGIRRPRVSRSVRQLLPGLALSKDQSGYDVKTDAPLHWRNPGDVEMVYSAVAQVRLCLSV